MKSSLLRLGSAALMAAFLATSCSKEVTPTPEEETAAAEAATAAEAESESADADVFDNVMGINAEVGMGGTGVFGEAAPGTSGEAARTTTCFTVTATRINSGTPFPLQVVLDFGAGCTDRHGRTRYGKIITRYSGPMRQPGSTAITTFEGYKIDSVTLSGTHTITNTSTASVRSFRTVVTEGRLTHDNGNYALWNRERILTQTEGLGTPDFPRDDVFSLEGSANGQVKKGDRLWSWKTAIEQPLIKRFNCRWIVAGTVRSWKADSAGNAQNTALLNYGSGACDNAALLIINGQERQITLH